MNIEALVGKVLGTCTLQKVIGRGEMSTVFLARQSRPSRPVAVKVLQPALPMASRQRAAILEHIRYEIDAVASLEHPNIIQIHEYGEYHGLAYLVMPYINGGTLHDEIAHKGALPLEKVMFYLQQMASALEYAHKHGVLHYDIKPANILMRQEGRLLLADFGQLKLASNRNNTYPRFTGGYPSTTTLEYAAPEQIIDNYVDTRANLYSLGVILYQMVTSIVPFKGAVTVQHIRPLPPRMLRPDLPVTAEQVILKALAVQPANRYPHVQEFACAFYEALAVANIPLSDLNSLFTSAGLTDAHIPTPQDSPNSAHLPTDNRHSDAFIDTSPTIYIMRKSVRRNNQSDNAPIDTSPAIRKVNKAMLRNNQNDKTAIDSETNKSIRRNDIIARTRLALPSLTDFLSPSHPSQASLQETPPAVPALKPVPPQLPAQPAAAEQKASPPPSMGEPDSQLPTTEARIQAAQVIVPEVLIEQAATLSPVNRLVHRIRLSPVVPIEQAATLPPIGKPLRRVKAPAKRASLFFLALIVLLVMLMFGSFAYMTSIHTPQPKDTLLPIHSPAYTGPIHTFSGPGNKSFHVEENPQLVIKGHNSNVDIHTGSAGTITVTTKMHGSRSALAANGVTIQYTQAVDKQGHDYINVAIDPPYSNIDYNITVPASAQIQVEVTSGSVTANGISGITIDTGGGNLDIADIQGPVKVHTESGDITAHTIKGQMQMKSVNGSIRASNINGQLQAVTRNGDIVLKEAALNGQSVLETTNGSIYFAGSLDPQGTYEMMTNSGNIDLALPIHTAFQLSASTHSGSIHNNFGNPSVGTTPRADLMITIGNGGSITINKAS